MTPKPFKDKPAGKVKLTKAQLTALRRVGENGETLRYAHGDAVNCGHAWFLKDYGNRVTTSTVWSLISKKLITAKRRSKETPWYATDYRITSTGIRALKESSK